MPLATGQLITDLTAEFTTPIPNKTMSDHAEALAEAYDDYCFLAATAYGAPLLTGGKSSFKSTFLSVINIPVPTIANYGLAIQSACQAYWAAAAFSVNTSPPPGMSPETLVVIAPPLPVIAGPITIGLAVSLAAAACANVLAGAEDVGTKTVTTTHTGIVGIIPTVIGPTPIV